MIMCAYNGFAFDFKLILPYLKKLPRYMLKNLVFMDPWFDMFKLQRINLKLDAAFKQIQVNTKAKYEHGAAMDVNKLRKLVGVRALHHQSLVMRFDDYRRLIQEGHEARKIRPKEMLPYCSKASFFLTCCRETMESKELVHRKNPNETVRIFRCQSETCQRTLEIRGRKSTIVKRKYSYKHNIDEQTS